MALEEERAYYDDYYERESLTSFSEQQEDDSLPKRDYNPTSEITGNYHCKSALRSHESNMKLSMYRKDFNILSKTLGGDPYDENIVKFLPIFWSCFILNVKDMEYEKDFSIGKLISKPSPALSTYIWKAKTLIWDNASWREVLYRAERDVAQYPITDEQIAVILEDYKAMNSTLYNMMIFLNMTLVVMNNISKVNESDPMFLIPGVISHKDGIPTIRFNEYFLVHMLPNCIKLSIQDKEYIMQKDIYLTIVDKVQERMFALMSCSIYDVLSPERDIQTSLRETVEWIIKFGDDLLVEYGNEAYYLLGKYEAYVITSCLTHDDPHLWDNLEFQTSLLNDDRENLPHMIKHSIRLVTYLNKLPICILGEIHGIWRIWGHPIIDIEGGLTKMQATSMKVHNVDNRETKVGGQTFMLIFFKNYRSKHGHYPLSNMSSKEELSSYEERLSKRDVHEWVINQISESVVKGSYLLRCLQRNEKIDDTRADYHHYEWERVVLIQNFQVPTTMNLATMIKDKAISMNRTDLIESVSNRRSVFDSQKRRGVLRWLKEQTIRVRDFLWNIDQKGLPSDSLIIGLYPKEREMKPLARFFSLMSYEIRMFVTITEEILSKHILKYFPMITMSDSLLDMIIRLYNMTTKIGQSGSSVTYCMNIDFSKWNQNMRKETNDNVFSKLDRVLGFRNVINYTHDMFKSCYLYLCSGEYIPAIYGGQLTTQSPYSRIGDGSGKEGLRQKGWTITTVCDILSLAYKHRVKIELIGGGDNQVLTITIRSPKGSFEEGSNEHMMRNIRRRMESFRNDLADKMKRRGLPLKLEETWISHRLLMYNKIMYYDGVPLSSTLKVASRSFAFSNEGIMTLGNIMSTLGTNFQAYAARDLMPHRAWMFSRLAMLVNVSSIYIANPICGFVGLDIFIREGKRDQETKRMVLSADWSSIYHHSLSCKDLYLLSLYYHKVLGGPGIGSPFSYMIKGFPDPLSEGLSWNYHVLDNLRSKDLSEPITSMTRIKFGNVRKWEHLVEDPVCVNHDAPPHGLAALRMKAEEVLRGAKIENVAFKELLRLGDNQYLTYLSTVLCGAEVLEPRLLHDMVGATLPGYVNSITSKVDQSSTLSKLSAEDDIITKVYEAELKYYKFMAKKIRINQGHVISRCATRDAEYVRNMSWKKRIVGVTVPHPSSFLKLYIHSSSAHECDQSYIRTVTKIPDTNADSQRGIFKPYFGSYTMEKFKQQALAAAYGEEDLLTRAIKVQKLLGWRYKEGSSMYSFIQKLVRSVTDADPSKFSPETSQITGDVEHRYHDMATKHGGIPCNQVTLYTHASCSTSTFVKHAKGAKNETLHFQACIIYCCMLSIMNSLSAGGTKRRTYHFHENCTSCIADIYNPTDEEVEPKEVPVLYQNVNSELTYVREVDIPVHYHIVRNLIKDSNRCENYNIRNFPQSDNAYRSTFCMYVVTLYSEAKSSRSSKKLWTEKYPPKMLWTAILLMYRMYITFETTSVASEGYGVENVMTFIKKKTRAILPLLSDPRFIKYNIEEGNIANFRLIDDGVDDVESLSSFLIKGLEASTCDMLRDHLPAMLDPQRVPSTMLWMMTNFPSILNCQMCKHDVCTTLRVQPTKTKVFSTHCSVHIDVNIPKDYHHYSLDKLMKNNFPIPLEMTNRMKKRKPSKMKTPEDRTIEASQKFLISWEDHVKLVNVEGGTRWSDDNTEPWHLILNEDLEKIYIIDMCTEYMVRTELMFVSYFSWRNIGNNPTNIIIWDIPIHDAAMEGALMAMYRLLKIQLDLSSNREDPLSIIPVIQCDMDIEEVPLWRIKYCKERIRQCNIPVIFCDIGDTSLDINDCIKRWNNPILTYERNLTDISWDAAVVFISNKSSEAYKRINEYTTRSKQYSVNIYVPKIRLLHDPPLVVRLVRASKNESNFVDTNKIVDLIEGIPSEFSSIELRMHSVMKSVCYTGESSISLYQTEVMGSAQQGIFRESDFISFIVKHTGKIYQQMMIHRKAHIDNWISEASIMSIIAILILCSSDRKEALSYYSKYTEFSIKRGSVNKIFLSEYGKRKSKSKLNLEGRGLSMRSNFGVTITRYTQAIGGSYYIAYNTGKVNKKCMLDLEAMRSGKREYYFPTE